MNILKMENVGVLSARCHSAIDVLDFKLRNHLFFDWFLFTLYCFLKGV